MTLAAVLTSHMVWAHPLSITTWLGATLVAVMLMVSRRTVDGIVVLGLQSLSPHELHEMRSGVFVVTLPMLLGGLTGSVALAVVPGLWMGLGLVASLAAVYGWARGMMRAPHGQVPALMGAMWAMSAWAGGLVLGPLAVVLALCDNQLYPATKTLRVA